MSEEWKSYSYPSTTLPTLEPSRHLEDLVEFREFLRGRRIPTENTRIDRYIQYLDQSLSSEQLDESSIFKNAKEGPFNSSIDWKLYVLREAHELMWILRGFKVRLPSGIDEHLKILIGGSDFAALDVNSQTRNVQFELRIASYFCQAGCNVDLGTGTDIVASTERETFFVECKRVASKNQLEKRLSEARRQLQQRMSLRKERRTATGCIAVDVTKAVFPHNGLTIGITNEHSKDIIQEKIASLTGELDTSSAFRQCRELIDCWFQVHIASLVLWPATPMTRFSSYHIFREDLNRKQRRAARAFRTIFESASRVDDRSHPPQPLVPRTRFEIPRGSVFNFDESIIGEMLEGGCAKERDQSQTVGSITIDGTVHEFSFFDLVLVDGCEVRNWKKDLGEDPVRARLELLMRMYAQRFRFDDPEPQP